MSELRISSLKVACKTFPKPKIAGQLGITMDDWIDLGFVISDAIHKRGNTPQKILKALTEEVESDAIENADHAPYSEILKKQLGLLSIGISKLGNPGMSDTINQVTNNRQKLYSKMTGAT